MLSDPLRQTALGDAPEIACPFWLTQRLFSVARDCDGSGGSHEVSALGYSGVMIIPFAILFSRVHSILG
jgi:hypothetical protein